jgi:hypothetical protein
MKCNDEVARANVGLHAMSNTLAHKSIGLGSFRDPSSIIWF